MNYFALVTITLSSGSKTLSIVSPASGAEGYKTESAARAAVARKRSFGKGAHFIVAQFENYKAAAMYRNEVIEGMN